MGKFISLLLVAVCVTFVFGYPSDIEKMEKMMKIVTGCQATTGASPEDVKMMMSKNEPESHEGKCMFNCILEGIDIVRVF